LIFRRARPDNRGVSSLETRVGNVSPRDLAAVPRFDVLYVDGGFVTADKAGVSPWANSLSYGSGTFEGMRASWNDEAQELYLLEPAAHYDRMHRSANALGLALPHSTAELVEITVELLRRNGARTDTYVRPLLLLGGETLQVRMHDVATRFSIALSPFPAKYIDPAGVRCLVSSWRRQSDTTLPLRAKVIGSYVGPALAKTEAMLAGFDEAIMLTVDGKVAEATTSNIFLRRGETWITPGPSDSILEGITRREVIELISDELAEPVLERSIDRSELYVSDEAFLCGTAVQIVPLVEVDRRPVADGGPGSRTRKLMESLRAISRREGERHHHYHWTIPIWEQARERIR
jgi:branched-chain amino acid aminotransferase